MLVRFVALKEVTSLVLPAVNDAGEGPLVEPERLSFRTCLRSAKVERPWCAGGLEPSSWKGETMELSKGERNEFENVCACN